MYPRAFLPGLVVVVAGAACSAQEPARTGAPAAPLAVVNGEAITAAEVEAAAGAQLQELRQQEYQIKSEVLRRIVFERLLAAEATKAGTSVEEYRRAAIAEKTAEPTPEEVQQVLQRFRTQLPPDEAQARQRVVEFLRQSKAQEREEAVRRDLVARHKVQILLEPPRVAVAIDADDPARGPANAPITIVEFSDFECPYCAQVKPTIAQLNDAYPGQIRQVFKHLPLPMHAHARLAAEASLCAGDQGRFWELHDWMFANQQRLDRDAIVGAGVALDLDAERFTSCVDQRTYASAVARDIAAAQALGINGTPAFVINGRVLSGAQPLAAFKEIIDEELSRTGGKRPS
jgi:protein-disulfide isomerase